jgi:thioredoxin
MRRQNRSTGAAGPAPDMWKMQGSLHRLSAEPISAFAKAGDIDSVLGFWAEWCAPCRTTAPVLEELARDKAGQIKVVKINVDHNPTTAGQFNIRSIPTLILFKDGRPVETLVGAMSKDALLQQLQPHLV